MAINLATNLLKNISNLQSLNNLNIKLFSKLPIKKKQKTKKEILKNSKIPPEKKNFKQI